MCVIFFKSMGNVCLMMYAAILLVLITSKLQCCDQEISALRQNRQLGGLVLFMLKGNSAKRTRDAGECTRQMRPSSCLHCATLAENKCCLMICTGLESPTGWIWFCEANFIVYHAYQSVAASGDIVSALLRWNEVLLLRGFHKTTWRKPGKLGEL